MRRFLYSLGLFLFGAALTGGLLAYFVDRKDPITHRVYDGLGRELSESPAFVQLVFGQDQHWAGWGWFGIDMLVFWGSLGIGAALMRRARSESQ